ALGKSCKCPKCSARFVAEPSEPAAVPVRELVWSEEGSPPRSAPPPVPTSTPEATKECPFCASSIPVKAKKCRECGETIDVALRAAEEAKRSAEAARREAGRAKRVGGANQQVVI